jgi:SAM-dependent methyltransferase
MLRWRAVLIAVMATGMPVVAAAQTATEPYTPKVGMPGKDAVWVPTSSAMVEKMLDLAKVTPQDLVMDLGSGDGRMIIAAARRGARAVGVEFNKDLVDLSTRTAASEGVSKLASFVQGDMFAADVSNATVLALFLLPEHFRKLTPKILAMKPGSRIVVNTFGIPDWEPDVIERLESNCDSWCEAKLYIVPAKVGGTWRLGEGTLTLEQTFQQVSGTLATGGRSLSVERGKLDGDRLSFSAGGRQYSARVSGDSMEGTATASGANEKFTAKRAAEKH